MTRLHDLHSQQGQSPWLDNLRRDWIVDGEIQRWVDQGVRGITSNPSIFQKSISTGTAYDEQFAELVNGGSSIDEAYWELVIRDIVDALGILRATYDSSAGEDGYVSVEVAPALAMDQAGTEAAARVLSERIGLPNLYVKIPATKPGVPAIRQMIAEGRPINVTLIFSLDRHAEVIEAYISGLEELAKDPQADLSTVSSVASFFISRVDTEIDKRLNAIGTEEALSLRGTGAVAQGQLAYQLFLEKFSGPRWEALAPRGARVQRPLWASTSTKNPAYPDTLYIDALVGPDTVNTIPDATLVAFEDHGTVARTIDADPAGAMSTWERIGALVDLDDVGQVLEDEGVASFQKAFDELLETLEKKATGL